ncbi:sensor histidine kinase [Arcobacter sp. FWKO B]|uniref:sensor histidine kinase n=1 Tax=Arcobacter sp. FWKO B TaxID=2593672 RepID=UPI0018A5D98D|nr:histidine kinase [Arcobacter sp. FWKO B]QOG12864.1 sensor histidine kinase [Arcobacter sp. FWKO B]
MDELRIKIQDWRDIVIFGILFGLILSGGIYIILEKSFFYGVVFGALNGLFIGIYSSLLITFLNTEILANIEKKYWNFLSFVFSFFAGFFGNLTATFLCSVIDIPILPNYYENQFIFASIVGLMTYFIGFILYKFVSIRNKSETIEANLAKKELEILEAQLNPHFLFNALNSSAELIHKDKDMAEMMLLNISSFLRQTLLKKTKISILEELNFVQNYVWIENIRFNQEIQLHIKNNLEDSNYYIPKFSIQLLVENAIKHNKIASKLLNIEIIINKNNDGNLYIDVIDDGDGFDDIQFGVGLRNLRDRLNLLHNGKVIYTRAYNQTIFSIILKDKYENSNY